MSNKVKLPAHIKEQIKQLRKVRKEVKNLIRALEDNVIPKNNEQGSPRFKAVGWLLSTASKWPINPSLISAALQLYSYQDDIAAAWLKHTLDYEIKRGLKTLRGK